MCEMVRLSIRSMSPWSSEELIRRRNSLIEMANATTGHTDRSVILMKGVDPVMQCGVPLPTKQKSSFRYLTGCCLPSASFLLESYKGKIERTTLFYDRRTKTEQLWDGEEKSIEYMREMYCIDKIEPLSSLTSYMESFSSPSTLLLSQSSSEFPHLHEWFSRCKLHFLDPFLDRIRLVKSTSEMEAMRISAEIGSQAIVEAIKSGEKTERAFAARLELEYARSGCSSAYPPVVAGGERACTVHYLDLLHPFHGGETVLVDAGCDYEGYFSDISRVFPVNGRFSKPQRVMYDLLETVQLTLIKEAQSGDLVLNSLFSSMLHIMGEVLKEAGVFTRELTTRELERVVEEISLHHIGHYLGLSIHDSPSVDRNIEMPPGCVFTIEPGFYVRHGNELIKREFHGLGMRIEDDLLVEDGGKVSILTHNCPKSINDIEALIGTNL
ncbi:hypothetical protein PFISCL1PPCAC_19824 [Pristionchus fissidentatus]|uniref:Aminopeptidase P N-terminal domain-containing protein n=1 Tax=Pristionchus fissidentatus TaxID=1538716 RepID=A0AAV5WF12_9BILA|nr:hypothetical protein PFISCL1PPCAC_19824 [Pristionchus fissidentatus]